MPVLHTDQYHLPRKFGPPDVTLVETNQLFGAMLKAAHKSKEFKRDLTNHNLVSFDPGETTGVALYDGWQGDTLDYRKTIKLCQINTKDPLDGIERLRACIPDNGLKTIAICEDYKVYSWKADSHSWAGLHTPQLIGMIRYMYHMLGIEVNFRMAQQAKRFATDEKLKSWGIYEPGMKHARDAERHLVTSLFFG